MGNSFTLPKNADKIYVAISTQYVPVVSLNLNPGPFKKIVSSKQITREDVFKCVSYDDLIVTTLDNAYHLMTLLNPGHNTTPDFIENGVFMFASPVLFEVDDYYKLDKILSYEDLCGYMNTQNIPLYGQSINKMFNPFRQVYDEVIKSILGGKCVYTKSKINPFNVKHVYCCDGFGRLKRL